MKCTPDQYLDRIRQRCEEVTRVVRRVFEIRREAVDYAVRTGRGQQARTVEQQAARAIEAETGFVGQ